MCVHVLPACMHVCHMHAVLTEVRRQHWVPWKWSYRQVWVAMWVLRAKPRFSLRKTSALAHWTISLTPKIPPMREVGSRGQFRIQNTDTQEVCTHEDLLGSAVGHGILWSKNDLRIKCINKYFLNEFDHTTKAPHVYLTTDNPNEATTN